jgi:hypothetical protein
MGACLDDTQRNAVLDALTRYDPVYDELFDEVSARIDSHGDIGKLDIAGLVFWKRIPLGRWYKSLLAMREADVREITRGAVTTTGTTQDRLRALRPLPGCKTSAASIASTLLTAWNPSDFAITDRRSRPALVTLLRMVDERAVTRYPEYLRLVRCVRDDINDHGNCEIALTARDIDKALWILGGGRDG